MDPAAAVRFSWQLAGSARGAAQAKYQLQVAAGPGSAAAPLWDSGMVSSNRTLHVPYGGDTPLEPDRRYSWRVRVAAGSGGPRAWSPGRRRAPGSGGRAARPRANHKRPGPWGGHKPDS